MAAVEPTRSVALGAAHVLPGVSRSGLLPGRPLLLHVWHLGGAGFWPNHRLDPREETEAAEPAYPPSPLSLLTPSPLPHLLYLSPLHHLLTPRLLFPSPFPLSLLPPSPIFPPLPSLLFLSSFLPSFSPSPPCPSLLLPPLPCPHLLRRRPAHSGCLGGTGRVGSAGSTT